MTFSIRYQIRNGAPIFLIMKLQAVLLLFGALQVSAAGFSQSVSFRGENVPLEKVFTAINEQTDYSVFYNYSLLQGTRPVSLNVRNASVEAVLYACLKGQGLTWSVEDKLILIKKEDRQAAAISDPPVVDTIALRGRVTDTEGLPLPGVSVQVKGTSKGTATGEDGRYELAGVDEAAVLVFSFVGFKTREVAADGRTEINVTLEPDIGALEEVVVIGYGEQSRRTLTTAIAKVSGEELSDIPISNVGEGLKGKIAGARVYSQNSTPGADPVIRIRGGSSINKSNAPLVLIDGVEMGLNDINPHDIESVEVLKDAASTAIYGSRASNGVILVTTKRGTANKAPRVTFQASLARQETERMYDFLNAEDYISYVRPATAQSPFPERNELSGYSASSANDETSIYTTRYLQPGEEVPAGWQSMADPLDPSQTLIFQDNNIRDILFSPALWQDYHVGVDGGSDIIRYSGSIGYTGDQGVGMGSGWDRFSARGNADTRIADKLNFSASLAYSQSTTEQYDNQRNVIARGLSTAPTHRLYWDDGTPAPGYNRLAPSPLWYDYTRDENQLDQRLFTRGLLDWNITSGLSAKVSGSYNVLTWQRDYFERAHEFDGSRPAESEFDQTRQSKLEAYLSYDKSLGDHTFSALAGYSYLDIRIKELDAGAMGAGTDKIESLNASPVKTEASTEFRDEVLISYFGRLSYDFKKKYLFSATLRRDGSSRFLEGNQWGIFPGVSAGWMISEESWFPTSSTLSSLKFRTSYGQTGNNAVGLYDAQGRYDVMAPDGTGYIYDGNGGIRSTAMPTPDLTWETSTQVDAGFDLGLFNDRINIIGDYFDKTTRDLLFEKPLPNTSGYQSVETNVGEVKFYGFDLEISSVNIQKENFEWTSSFTWSFVKNKVLKLPDNGREKNRIGGVIVPGGGDYGGIAEGEPLYRYYGYQVDHIIQTQQEADNARFDESSRGFSPVDGERIKGRKLPGDYEWVDRNGDGIINYIDQFELGVTVPHTTGGLNNQFRYKNWSLKVYVDWALGHAVNDNAFMRYFMNTFAYNYALAEEVKQTWTEPGDDAKYARLTANDPGDGSNNFARTSSAFNFNGDYLCIREVTLRYNVPSGLAAKLGMQGLNVYVSGNNLHYFSGLIGTSPETGASTTYSNNDYFNYPPVRRYSFGITATF